MKSETAKLPKGQSYPLRPSVLEEALALSGLSIDTHVKRAPGRLFDAYFWPPNPNVPYERLYICSGSVPSDAASETRSRMESVALPALMRWVAHILASDAKSPVRREQQHLDLSNECVGPSAIGKR